MIAGPLPGAAMTSDHNPQARQMGDESMARNLALQAGAIWPQEQALFERYGLDDPAMPVRILDLGCGTGEITWRLAQRFPHATLVGIDILPENVRRARAAGSGDGGRVSFQAGDAFALPFADALFDLVVCRHMSQAVPDFARVLDGIGRVLRPGGWLHLLSEDYAMLHFPHAPHDPDHFWQDTVLPYLASIGCDGRIGRHSPALLAARSYEALAVDYVVVDTLRVPRPAFAGIIHAWRDGYVDALATASGRPPAAVRADFDAMAAAIETPPHYAVWQVPVVSGRRSAAM